MHAASGYAKAVPGLQGIVNEEFGRYLTLDEAFVFIGKTMKTAKIIYFHNKKVVSKLATM